MDEPLLALLWGSSVAVRLDYGGRRLHGKRPGTSRLSVPEEARHELTPRNVRHDEPPRGPWAVASVVEGFKIGDIIPISDTSEWVSLGAMLVRMNVGPTAGAVVYCWSSGRAISLDRRPYRNTVSEADDARTLSMVRNRRGARAREFRDACAELTEDHYDDWDLDDDIRSLLRLLQRMNCDGMSLVAWTEA